MQDKCVGLKTDQLIIMLKNPFKGASIGTMKRWFKDILTLNNIVDFSPHNYWAALHALVIWLSHTYSHVPDEALMNNHQASYFVSICLIYVFSVNIWMGTVLFNLYNSIFLIHTNAIQKLGIFCKTRVIPLFWLCNPSIVFCLFNFQQP